MGSEKIRVGVVGAGPSGLACLRVFLQFPDRYDVVAFEARSDIGGVWFRESAELQKDPQNDDVPSGIYDSLTTNIPHPAMAFNRFPFAPATYLFPQASDVFQYQKGYAAHFKLLPHVILNAKVTICNWNKKEWTITLKSGEQHHFDRIMITNGHYHKPHFPSIGGIESWGDGNRTISHSAFYREPSRYAGRRVLVIGNGPSGSDIGREISQVAEETFIAGRNQVRDDTGVVKLRPAVVELLTTPEGNAVYQDGTVDRNIDDILLATGYEYSYPMFSQITQRTTPTTPPFPPRLQLSPECLYPLARQIFPLQDDFPPTSIAFIGIPFRVAPFPLFEAQAAVAESVFSNPSRFDIEEEKRLITERRETLMQEVGGDAALPKVWHKMDNGEEFRYRRELFDYAGVTDWKVEDWIVAAYNYKVILRTEWRDIVHAGEAEDYVKLAKTDEDWANVIQRVLERARRRDKFAAEIDNTI